MENIDYEVCICVHVCVRENTEEFQSVFGDRRFFGPRDNHLLPWIRHSYLITVFTGKDWHGLGSWYKMQNMWHMPNFTGQCHSHASSAMFHEHRFFEWNKQQHRLDTKCKFLKTGFCYGSSFPPRNQPPIYSFTSPYREIKTVLQIGENY